ncbi:MAG: GNAT family N-acetyltransferase [Treponema sp.]|nr:GNAT family N-acetyltransferase [Treponema sp.]
MPASGIGRSLVSEVEKKFREEGIHKIALVGFKTNEQGNQFWENQGFLVRDDSVYRNKNLIDENQ